MFNLTVETVKASAVKIGDMVKDANGFFVEVTGVDFGSFGRVYLGVNGEACYKGITVENYGDIEILVSK